MINKKYQKYYVKALFKSLINLGIIETLKLIFNNDIQIYLNSLDIFYEYKENNKTVKREEKVIIFTTETMRNKLKDPKIDNYFIDITYLIIPKVFKHYKLMTITCVDNDTKNTFIIGLIFLKF